VFLGLLSGRRRIIAAQYLIRKADAIAADVNAGTGDQAYSAEPSRIVLGLPAKGALRLVANLVLPLAATEDHFSGFLPAANRL
jgi:hypothetical protein